MFALIYAHQTPTSCPALFVFRLVKSSEYKILGCDVLAAELHIQRQNDVSFIQLMASFCAQHNYNQVENFCVFTLCIQLCALQIPIFIPLNCFPNYVITALESQRGVQVDGGHTKCRMLTPEADIPPVVGFRYKINTLVEIQYTDILR